MKKDTVTFHKSDMACAMSLTIYSTSSYHLAMNALAVACSLLTLKMRYSAWVLEVLDL